MFSAKIGKLGKLGKRHVCRDLFCGGLLQEFLVGASNNPSAYVAAMRFHDLLDLGRLHTVSNAVFAVQFAQYLKDTCFLD